MTMKYMSMIMMIVQILTFKGDIKMIIEKIGNASLILGDCKDVINIIDKHDLMITDPPYGIGISSNPVRGAHKKKSWDDSVPSIEVLESYIELNKYSIIFGGNYFHLKPAGKGFYIWDKCQPEKFSLAMCEFAYTNIDEPAKIFRMDVKSYKKDHPTQKPVDLISWLIDRFPEGKPKSIIDPFMGSGTTLIASLKQGISCTGIEKDKEYFEKACDRVYKFQNIKGLDNPDIPQMELF